MSPSVTPVSTFLAISDLHGDFGAVRRLREIETNRFSAIIVAGDIDGSDGSDAAKIMGCLHSFACPVLFVLGNWDSNIPYDVDWGTNCFHLHHRAIEIGEVRFVGMSGVVQNWGLHPIATEVLDEARRVAKLEHERDVKRRRLRHPPPWFGLDQGATARANREIERRNRAGLVEVIRQGDPRCTIVVTHDRLYRMHEDVPGVPLYLFGHKHEPVDNAYQGSRYLNVSHLDVKTRGGDGDVGGWYYEITISADLQIRTDYANIYSDEQWDNGGIPWDAH